MTAKASVQLKERNLKLVPTGKSQDKKQVPTKKRVPKKLTRKQLCAVVVENQEHGQRLAWKFLKGWRVRLHPDEVRSVVGLALSEAASRFDPSKNVAFKTFFFYHLRGMLLKEITRLVHESRINEFIPTASQTSTSSADDIPQSLLTDIWPFGSIEQKTPEILMHKREIARLCWEVCSCLDELEHEVVYRHYVDDQSLKVIADDLEYCRCHISRVKSRAIRKLQQVVRRSAPLKEMFLNKPERPVACGGSQQTRGLKYTGARGRRQIPEVSRKSTALEKQLKIVNSGS